MQIANDFTALTTNLVWTDDFGDVRTEITFGFADRAFAHHIPETTPQMRASVQALTPAEMAVARQAFQSWEDTTIIDFTEVNAAQADIIVTLTDFRSDTDLDDTLGFAFQPEGDELDGDIFIDLPFSDSLPLYIHEIGHSLGLDHSFDGARVFGDLSLDRIENTIMGDADFEDATGPGAFDIQAIQSMYANGAPAPDPDPDPDPTPDPDPEPTIDATAGPDALTGGSGADVILGLGGADTINGGLGRDTIEGNGGRDVLNGNQGRDDIDGGGGRDQINGNGGRDMLAGGGGRDALNGGGGADTLDGGRGRDMLTGGNGADLFVFSNGGPRDTITDFTFDIDRIEFVGANSIDDLIFSDIGGGAVVRFGNAKVLIEGVDSIDLISDDFLF